MYRVGVEICLWERVALPARLFYLSLPSHTDLAELLFWKTGKTTSSLLSMIYTSILCVVRERLVFLVAPATQVSGKRSHGPRHRQIMCGHWIGVGMIM